jgi:PAS domain S-box-containing protein
MFDNQEQQNFINETEQLVKMGSWKLDLATQFSEWSEGMFRIYNKDSKKYSPSILNTFEMMSEEDALIMQTAIKIAIATKEPQKLIYQITCDNYKNKTLEANGKAVYNDEGIATHIVGTTIDITERTKLEQATKELAQLVEHSTSEVYIVSADRHQYLYANRGGLKNLGYRLDELLMMTIYDINKELTKDETTSLSVTMKDKDSIVVSSMHYRKDGTSYPVQAHIQRIVYHDKDAYVIFDTDISELKSVQEKLHYQAN